LQQTPPSSGESANHRFLGGGAASAALRSGTRVSPCRSECSTRSRRWRPAQSSRTSGSAQRWRSRASCKRRIRQTVGGAIHDASGHRTIWRHRVCRQRAAHRATFWLLQPSEASRVSFQLCTADYISTLREQGRGPVLQRTIAGPTWRRSVPARSGQG